MADPSDLRQLMSHARLHVVFEPIARLKDGHVMAHEALIRAPADALWATPEAMRRTARAHGLSQRWERTCARLAIQRWGQLRERGRLFINMGADELILALTASTGQVGLLSRYLQRAGVLSRQVVVEVTEPAATVPLDTLAQACAQLRNAGFALSLDDNAAGTLDLRTCSHLRPDYLRLPPDVVRDVASQAAQSDAVSAWVRAGKALGAELIAEGVDDLDDLRALRELGVDYAQSWILGWGLDQPSHRIDAQALRVLMDPRVAVGPARQPPAARNGFSRLQIIQAPTVTLETPCEQVADLLQRNPDLHALAVVDEDRPVGLINRMQFLTNYSKRYYPELWGRKPCMAWANMHPRIIEADHKLDELLGILTSDDQRYLSDGFIVVENGRYVGLCRGDQIVRSVTEMRVEAARHANPLTFLPGNLPITQHIDRLLSRAVAFVVAYLDLNHFKAFNDRYGYWRGDEMIRLLAQVAGEHVRQQHDFLGHVGGDDFVIVYQDGPWLTQCQSLIKTFNQRALAAYDPADRAAGGIQGEDRLGVPRFFPCVTLSVGVVQVRPGQFANAEQVANAAAAAKHQAKTRGDGLAVLPGPDDPQTPEHRPRAIA